MLSPPRVLVIRPGSVGVDCADADQGVSTGAPGAVVSGKPFDRMLQGFLCLKRRDARSQAIPAQRLCPVRAMAEYRLYSLDKSRRIVRAAPAECVSDQEALQMAQSVAAAGQDIEVWQRDRRVGLITRP